MSVISLSSEDEDDCIVLDSDVEDFGGRSPYTHQVFIVENIQSSSFNEETGPSNRDNQNFDKNEHSASPDDVQKENPLSDQTSEVLSETKEICSEKKDKCSTSQRDEILGALQLASVSLQNDNCGETLTNCHTLPPTSENKSESALKVLAEKLAQVLGSNNHAEVCMSSFEQTILDVSRGEFTYCVKRPANKQLVSKTTSQTNINKIQNIKTKKKHIEENISKSQKVSVDVKVSDIQAQSSLNQLMRIVSETDTKVNKIIPQDTTCVGKNSNIQPSQLKTPINKPNPPLKKGKNIEVPGNASSSKQTIEVLSQLVSVVKSTFSYENKQDQSRKTRSPDPKLVSINQTNVTFHEKKKEKLKQKRCDVSKKKINPTKLYNKPCSLKKGEPYDNKLKFTFDRSISSYSVSVVSPTECQPPVENINISQNCIESSTDKNSSSCQRSYKKLTDDKNTEIVLQLETLASDDIRLPIPFSEILNLKSSFVKHYNMVFDDKTDVLCVEMGYSLLQTIEESKNLERFMQTSDNVLSGDIRTQQTQNFLLGSDELKTAIETCKDVLEKSKRKFTERFSQIYDQINRTHIIGTQLKIVMLTAWFMKMFLSITKKSPDLMDILHEVKIKALQILSVEIVRWPLIHYTFIKNEHQFECDCLLVLEFIKDCLNDRQELNSQSDINLSQTEECHTSNREERQLEKLQMLAETCDTEVPVVTNNSNETKTSNRITVICRTDSCQSQINRKDSLLDLQTKVDESDYSHSPKNSSREPLQINPFPSNIDKTDFQRIPNNNYFGNTDQSSTKSCGPFELTHSYKKPNTAGLRSSNSEVNSKEVFLTNSKRKQRKANNERVIKCQKTNTMQHLSNVQKPKKRLKIYENDQPIPLPSSVEPFDSKSSRQADGIVLKHLNAENIHKTNLENKVLCSKINLQQKSHITFPNGQDQVQNQLYEENRSQEPITTKQSHDSNVFLSSEFDNQYNSSYTFESYEHDQQNIQCFQSHQPIVYNHHDSRPTKYSQNHYNDQVDYRESSAYQIKITTPTNTNSCQDNYVLTNSCASNYNKQQFPVRNGERIEVSSCPTTIRTPGYSICDVMSKTGVTINNYNITNYPSHIPPDLITNYNDPNFSFDKRTGLAGAVHLSSNLNEK